MEDSYMWMENLEDERVLKIVEEENKRFRSFIGDLSDKVFNEVSECYSLPRIWEARITKNGIFLGIDENGKQVIKNIDSGDIIVDSKELEKEIGDEILLQSFEVDKNGKLLAYNFSIGGSDEGITRIVDIQNGKIMEEIKPSIWNVIFLNEGYYFTKFFRREKTPDGMDPPAERVFLKKGKEIKMIFGEGLDGRHFMNLKKSRDGRFIILTLTEGWNRSDIYMASIDDPEDWKKIYSCDKPAEPINYVGGKLYVLTREGNGLGKIIALEENRAEEIVKEGEYPLEWAVIVGDKILAGYLIDASSRIKVFDLKGEEIDEIKFDMLGKATPMDEGEEVIIKFESFTLPYRIYRYRENLEVIDEFIVSGNFEISEDFAVSKDGTKIHYFIVEGKESEELKGRAWVFGYGGFNISLSPRFFPHVVPFLKRGGTFVMANLRGGSEYGEEWHRAGMRENKQNVFDDYIAVLQKLKDEGYRVAAWGRSNGGLLVSATLVQRPDVMDSAIIGYPVIDMMRFHKLYIGSVWIPEYGDPDTEDREFLIKYSPYHNVKPNDYPPILIYTGLHDDRVHPAHALKFFMKLKEYNAPVYLRVETKSGHMGASPETRIRELADMLAFVIKTLSGEEP